MTRDKDEQRQFMDAMQRFSDNADKLMSLNSGNTTSSIQVNAGGIGVWACLTACIMMLAMVMIGGMWMSREFNRIDREMTDRREGMERMQTYLSAIYAQAPHLKPKEEENAK